MGTPVELVPKDILNSSEVIERLQTDGKVSSLRAHLTQGDTDKLDAATPAAQEDIDKSRMYSGVEAEDLVDMLNRIIESDEIYNEQQMGTVKLPKEGLRMLALVNEGEELSRDQRVRFHRFLLEGVFPRGLAKLYGKGWRPIMYIYGFAGIFVAAFFWIFFHNRPEVHPWSNETEHALILEGREELSRHDGQKLEPAPLKALVLSFNMWCSCFSQWGTNVGWVFLVTWLSRYLLDVHSVPHPRTWYDGDDPCADRNAGYDVGGESYRQPGSKTRRQMGTPASNRRLSSRRVVCLSLLCCDHDLAAGKFGVEHAVGFRRTVFCGRILDGLRHAIDLGVYSGYWWSAGGISARLGETCGGTWVLPFRR